MNLVLIGFKSCGKSTTGRLVADRTGLRFVDLDTVFEELFYEQFKIRCNYREPFLHYGEDLFRRVEHDSLQRITGEEDIVLATGGGAPLPEANRKLLRQIGPVVYLQVTPEAVFERLQANGMPSYLRQNPTLDGVREIWEYRHPIYADLATTSIDVSSLTPPEVADRVVAWMESLDPKAN